ncbi:8-amino-7-oxononanoate synthase [Biformimicrobium ophioploci]
MRRPPTLAAAPTPYADVEGRRLLAFCSNDYLGLAAHPDVIAAQQAAAALGAGATASHLVNGHLHLHAALEQQLAEVTGREAALLFSTGYMANMGAIEALLGRADIIVSDKLNHASLIDGARLCGAEKLRFAHNDLEALERQLRRARTKSGSAKILVVVDSVFSMDGDLAPLPQIAELCARYDAWLMADDAHAVGVIGSPQRPAGGSAEFFGLSQQQLPIVMGTLGKALGNFGAFVAGSAELIEYLRQFARTHIYTTALPPAVAGGTLAALRLAGSGELQQRLCTLVDHFRSQAAARGIDLLPSQTAIQPVLIGDEKRTLAIGAELQRAGFMVGAIRPPTVPAGTARLRITLSATHTEAQIDALLDALATALSKNKPVAGAEAS